jgi:hypothetical protein
MQSAPFLTVPMPLTARPPAGAGGGVLVQAEVAPHTLAAHAVSAAARSLAERVGSRLIGGPLRVACLMPAGRPVVLPIGDAGSCMVSVAHSRSLLAAAACRGVGGVGIDIVAPAESSAALDWCFDAAEAAHADDDASRARLWAAKEAAYKAARIDAGFQPRRVRIEPVGAERFCWSIAAGFGMVDGVGSWSEAGGHVVAVAVQPTPGRSLAIDALAVICREAAPCS